MRHKNCKLLLAIIVSMGIVGGVSAGNAQLQDTMKMLKEECQKLGPARVDGSALYFGETKMNGNYKIVDEIKEKFNCTATLFVKRGDKFIRVSTNVVKDDGNRAVGTELDPQGKAIAAIRKGEVFAGEVDILGKPYDTIYEPIYNAANEIVGVYYVGIPK